MLRGVLAKIFDEIYSHVSQNSTESFQELKQWIYWWPYLIFDDQLLCSYSKTLQRRTYEIKNQQTDSEKFCSPLYKNQSKAVVG